MRRWILEAVLVVAVVAIAAAVAAPPRLRLVSAPAAALVGTRVPVTIAAPGARQVSVWIRLGSQTKRFRAARIGKGRFRARVAFPAPGRWTLGARVGSVSRVLRPVLVDERRVREPFRAVLASDGLLLVADGFANRILRVSPANGVTTTFAGTGGLHRAAPGVDARRASIGRPLDVAIAPNGDVAFISDELVSKIEAGTFTLRHVAGTTDGHGGDGGPAAQAQLKGPTALAYDSGGNLYIAEYGGYVRRVDAQTGVITTVAGIGIDASTGDGGPATAAAIDRPHGIAVASDGTILVSDSYGRRLRRISGGTISTVAELDGPTGLFVLPDGTVYAAEAFGSAVSRVDAAGRVTRVARVEGASGAVVVRGRLFVTRIGPPNAGTGSIVRIDDRGRAQRVTR